MQLLPTAFVAVLPAEERLSSTHPSCCSHCCGIAQAAESSHSRHTYWWRRDLKLPPRLDEGRSLVVAGVVSAAAAAVTQVEVVQQVLHLLVVHHLICSGASDQLPWANRRNCTHLADFEA